MEKSLNRFRQDSIRPGIIRLLSSKTSKRTVRMVSLSSPIWRCKPHTILSIFRLKWLDQCKGRYDQGYDAIRAARVLRMKELGIISQGAVTFHVLEVFRLGTNRRQMNAARSARKMELLSAMVEQMDDNIGKLLDYSRRTISTTTRSSFSFQTTVPRAIHQL